MSQITQSRKLIVQLVRRHYEMAIRDHREATARHAATVEGRKVWDAYNPNDGVGGMSSCPYNVERDANQLEKTTAALSGAQHAYELAIDTFLEESDDDVGATYYK